MIHAVDVELIQDAGDKVVALGGQRPEEVGDYPSEQTVWIQKGDDKNAAPGQKGDGKSEDTVTQPPPGFQIAMPFLFVYPAADIAYHILQNTQGTNGGAIHPSKYEGEKKNNDETRCDPRENIEEFQQGRDELKVDDPFDEPGGEDACEIKKK
jgi:hypothetical protein